MRIIISEFMDESALNNFPADYSVHYDPELVDKRSELLHLVQEADAIIVRNRTQVDAELLSHGTKLKAIGRLGVGLDNIDLDLCQTEAISVLPAIGANAISVMEYVMAAAMMLVRGCFFSNADMIQGNWPRASLGKGGEVHGRIMGLCGFGGIAQLVAEKAMAMDMRVIAYDPFLNDDHPAWQGVQKCELDDLLAQADILSIHVPLTADTANLFDASTFHKMKPNAVLINTSRGGIMNELDLAQALKTATIAGAAIDVFADEPLLANQAQAFADCPNLILSPHVAGVTDEGNVRVSYVTVENVMQALEVKA